MSKREKKLGIEIKEVTAGDAVKNEVYVNQSLVGQVQQDGSNAFVASNETSEMRVKTLDEGIQWVIAEFNLHSL